MEPFENIAKMRVFKAMMSQNHDASKAFKDMSAAYDAHLLLYSHPTGGVSGVDRTQLNLKQNKILKWQDFDLTFSNTYMETLNAKPGLMEEYAAALSEIDEMKDDLSLP
jgi:hypothetical protein